LIFNNIATDRDTGIRLLQDLVPHIQSEAIPPNSPGFVMCKLAADIVISKWTPPYRNHHNILFIIVFIILFITFHFIFILILFLLLF
jgi:hypothetical protein